jgi:predicted dehydrogenase
VAAVYDINPERNQAARAEGLKAWDSLPEILGDRAIETLILAVPNNFHKDLALAALKAGKHVICEKPGMLNTADLETVLATARDTGRTFSVHQNRRWDRDYLIVRKLLQEGTIGQPFYIESRVQGSKGIPGDWRCEKVAGGGMLYDWGVHLIDQILTLTDSPVVDVYAHLLSVKFPGVDDNFKLLLRFANNLSALIEVDTYTFISLPRWHISGTGGTAQVDDFACHGKIARANTHSVHWEEGIVYTEAGPTRTMAPRSREPSKSCPATGDQRCPRLLPPVCRGGAAGDAAAGHRPGDASCHAGHRRRYGLGRPASVHRGSDLTGITK